MISAILTWWLALVLIGWVSWPLLARILPSLSDHGYAFAKAFGLILIAYLYWLLGLLGVPLQRNLTWWGLLAVVVLGGLWGWVRQRRDLLDLLKTERDHIITVEILWVVVFLLGVVQVGYDANLLQGGRLAGLAGIMAAWRSPSMPPQDPWMAGEALPAPYWGYLIVALVARATGISGSMAYNLANAHTLALVALVVYGLLYNVIHTPKMSRGESARRLGVLGALMIGIGGHLEGVIEYVHLRGFAPRWLIEWLRIPGLSQAPIAGGYVPLEPEWWRRAAQMFAVGPGAGEFLVTEFPVFSFLLGDLKPLYLALPFWGLALAVALELGLSAREDLTSWWKRPRFWAMGWVIGALAPLGPWAFSTALGAVVAAWYLGQAKGAKGWSRLLAPGALILMAVVPYLPHYFSLPVGRGMLAVPQTPPTRLGLYFLFFAPWLTLILGDTILVYKQMRQGSSPLSRFMVIGVMLALLGLCFGGAWIVGGGQAALHRTLEIARRPWLVLGQVGLMSVLLIALWREASLPLRVRDMRSMLTRLLACGGLGLTLIPEWVAIVPSSESLDLAMPNLYYLAWGLLGVAGISALPRLWNSYGSERSLLWLAALFLLGGLYYPFAAAWTRAGAYQGNFDLDGLAQLERDTPELAQVHAWLMANGNFTDVLVEAPGQEGDALGGFLSAATGLPTILGWPEYQAARHGRESVSERLADLDIIYRSQDKAKVLATLGKYHVTYLYVGPRERERYLLTESSMDWKSALLRPVFLAGEHVLYSVR